MFSSGLSYLPLVLVVSIWRRCAELEMDKNIGQSLFTKKKGYCITNSCGFGLGLVDSFSYTKDDEARVRNTRVTSGKVSFNHPVLFRNMPCPQEADIKD